MPPFAVSVVNASIHTTFVKDTYITDNFTFLIVIEFILGIFQLGELHSRSGSFLMLLKVTWRPKSQLELKKDSSLCILNLLIIVNGCFGLIKI